MRKDTIKEIEDLYKHLLQIEKGSGLYKINSSVRSKIYMKIIRDVEALKHKQESLPSWSKDYWEIDKDIRRLLLKEIQIIIDDYVIARNNGHLSLWESMYGDIEHYKEIFYTLRMDTAYHKKKKDAQRLKFVKGKWERVEYMKLEGE